MLTECPTGKAIRETPDVYAAIEAQAYAEVGALNPLEQTGWMQSAMRIASAERARLADIQREQEKQRRQSKGDADYARRLTSKRRAGR